MDRRQTNIVDEADTQPGAERHYRRDAIGLTIAAVLFLIAALGSTLTAARLRDATELVPRDEVLRSGPLASRAALEAPDQGPAFRLLAALQPLDAAVHLAGLDGARDTIPLLPVEDEERLSARSEFFRGDLGAVLRRGRRTFAWRTVEDSLAAEEARLEATPSLFPTRGYISSGFTRSRPHPILELTREHKGLDIVAPVGTPIVAAARGRVRFVGQHIEYGRMVEIDHGYGVVTRYAHASRTLVRRGQLVGRGDTIANVGMSGLAAGPHLHYEVLVHGVPANPNRYVFDLNVIPD